MSPHPSSFDGAVAAKRYCRGLVTDISGPRRLSIDKIEAVCATVVELGADVGTWVTGGAVGIDVVVMQHARMRFPDARHLLVVPGPGIQPEVDEIATALRIRRWVLPADTSFLDRNRAMNWLSQQLLAFPKTPVEEFRGSGTWACIRDATKNGLAVRKFPLSELT